MGDPEKLSIEETLRLLLKKIGAGFMKFVFPEIVGVIMGPVDFLVAFTKQGPFSVFTKKRADYFYLVLVAIMTVFGLAVHYSAEGANKQQVGFAVGGIIALTLISFIKVDQYKRLSNAAMAVALGLMILTLILKQEKNGTYRWVFHVQPSEVGKIAMIMFFAYLIDKYRKKKEDGKKFMVFLGLTGFFALLIFLEIHLSGTILFLGIGYLMMWYGGMNKKWFLAVTLLAAGAAAILVISPQTFSGLLKDYQLERIIVWKKILFNGEITAGEKIGNARQVLQSIYGIGSGGLWGKGYGNSGQKINNLSEKSNDFIFAVLGEEAGFIGAIFMLAGFGLLVWRGCYIAARSNTYYGALVAYGISTQVALQVIINVGVATSLLPNTGISLPFFSDGGSSMIMTLVSMGLVLGISRDMGEKEEVKKDA